MNDLDSFRGSGAGQRMRGPTFDYEI